MVVTRSEATAYKRVVTEDADSSDDEPETEEERLKHAQMLKLKKGSDKRKWLRRKV